MWPRTLATRAIGITASIYRKTALRFKRAQLEDCLHILQRLDTDLKSSKLDADLLMQKALCELALAGRA